MRFTAHPSTTPYDGAAAVVFATPYWAFCPAAVRAARAAATPFSFRLLPNPVESLASGPSVSPKACRQVNTGGQG